MHAVKEAAACCFTPLFDITSLSRRERKKQLDRVVEGKISKKKRRMKRIHKTQICL